MSKLIFICASWIAMLVWGEFVILKLYTAVADQGFTPGKGTPIYYLVNFFATKKWKNLDREKGARVPSAPSDPSNALAW